MYSILFYIFNLIAPLKLSALHPSPEITHGLLPLKYYLSSLFITGLLILLKIIIKRTTNNKQQTSKTIIFGALFFLFTISVTLIVGKLGHSEVAERYTYIPYIGLFLIIGYLLSFTRRQLSDIIIVVFILIFSIVSFERNKVWSNGISLFSDVIEKYPKAYSAYISRGAAKIASGDTQGALEDYNRAIEINQEYALAYYNRGLAKYNLIDKKGSIRRL